MTPNSESEYPLSGRTLVVMESIAEGYSYDQILHIYPDMTYQDIFAAAEEVLRVVRKESHPAAKRQAPPVSEVKDRAVGQPKNRPAFALQEVRRRHPRAYEKWTPNEESQLRKLLEAGYTVARIAGQLGRQRGAIRSRIMRLGWVSMLSPKEQSRLNRIVAREGGNPASDTPDGVSDA